MKTFNPFNRFKAFNAFNDFNALNDSTIHAIREVLDRDRRIQAAFLHGSAVKGCLRPDSDVDLALLPAPGQRITARERMEMAGELISVVGRPVDIGVMDHTNVVYEKEVATGGRCIYCRDEAYRDQFMAVALSLYVQLRFERREVELAYAVEKEL